MPIVRHRNVASEGLSVAVGEPKCKIGRLILATTLGTGRVSALFFLICLECRALGYSLEGLSTNTRIIIVRDCQSEGVRAARLCGSG